MPKEGIGPDGNVRRAKREKEDNGLDIITLILTVTPFKVGAGIGVIAFVYGTVKMEISFGALGFFLCLMAGIVAELFI